MASLWHRAMVYLGLQDDDDVAYDEYDYDDAGDPDGVGGAPRDPRSRQGTFEPRARRESQESTHTPIRDPRVPREPRDPHDAREAAEGGVTVRPVARDEAADLAPQRSSVERIEGPSPRVHVVEPRSFNDVQEVGDRVKANQPVVLNLQGRDRELQRRLIDFSSGLAYAMGYQIQRVNDQVFLLKPSNVEVAPAEKERLQARGLYRT